MRGRSNNEVSIRQSAVQPDKAVVLFLPFCETPCAYQLICGRISKRRGERYSTAIRAAGTRNTSEPGTHMITPAEL